MSKSRKKTKIRAITGATSEKENKRDANRRYRRVVKHWVKIGKTDLPQVREMSNVWHFDKDGKIFDARMTKEDLRK